MSRILPLKNKNLVYLLFLKLTNFQKPLLYFIHFSEYIGAGPAQGSGLHRYVFLIYKQNKKEAFLETPFISNTSVVNRRCFSARNFASQYHFDELVAANFLQAEWDEYVPELRKQLGLA